VGENHKGKKARNEEKRRKKSGGLGGEKKSTFPGNGEMKGGDRGKGVKLPRKIKKGGPKRNSRQTKGMKRMMSSMISLNSGK